jgi:hypothetical protein
MTVIRGMRRKMAWGVCNGVTKGAGSAGSGGVKFVTKKRRYIIGDTEGFSMELRFLRDTDKREIDFVVLKKACSYNLGLTLLNCKNMMAILFNVWKEIDVK